MKIFLVAILCAAAAALFAAAFVANSLQHVEPAAGAHSNGSAQKSLLAPDANKTAEVSGQPHR